jgi:tetratricopeptide (TPR) repeat protein
MNNGLTLFPEFEMEQHPTQKTWHVGLSEDQQSTLRQRARNIKRISALATLMRGREFEAAQQELRYTDNGFAKWTGEEVGVDHQRAYEDIKIWKAYGVLLMELQNSGKDLGEGMLPEFLPQNSGKDLGEGMLPDSGNIEIGRTVLLESSKDDVPQSAREEIVRRHASGEKVTIEEAKDIIEYQKKAKEAEEQAKEDARRREEAERKLEEAEKLAKEAEEKLKEQEEEEEILQELIRGLKEEKKKIEESKVQTIKEDTDETIQKLDEMDKKIKLLEKKQEKSEEEKKKFEEDLKLSTEQKKNLSDAKKELEKQIKEYRENDRKHKHIERVRTRFGQARDAIRHGLQQASARWISPIDAEQAFEPDDWAALDQTLADLKRWEEECTQLKKSVTSRFIDATPVAEAPIAYIEAGRS